MALLKPKNKSQRKQIKFSIEENLLAEINKYCDWAGINKVDDFLEQAAEYVLKRDKDWKISRSKK